MGENLENIVVEDNHNSVMAALALAASVDNVQRDANFIVSTVRAALAEESIVVDLAIALTESNDAAHKAGVQMFLGNVSGRLGKAINAEAQRRLTAAMEAGL